METAAGTSAASDVPATGADAGSASRGAGSRRGLRLGPYLGLLPFFLYVSVFLLLPMVIVGIGAFQNANGQFTMSNLDAVLSGPEFADAFILSLKLSVITALAGAVVGALLAWAVAQGNPNGLLRQTVVAASGVLAQFGGVMLAFAFLATFGFSGWITQSLVYWFGLDNLAAGTWLYGLLGLSLVYTYFQIPLMVIVFLPAVDGLRKEWWDASSSLGGGTWAYWRYVGGPILAPTFLGATLLLFTNAFSAYATAAALISQGQPLVTLQIRWALTSEMVLGQENIAKVLALGMVIIVSLIMVAYSLLQRRTAKWVK
jgi:putative spermidine/putrescine transport system permease protein